MVSLHGLPMPVFSGLELRVSPTYEFQMQISLDLPVLPW